MNGLSLKKVAQAIGILTVVLIVAVLFLQSWDNSNRVIVGRAPKVNGLVSIASEYPQIALANNTKQQAVRESLDRLENDPEANGKIPIRFYGRVVDENVQPVANANIRFQWTNLSSQGTSESFTTSSAQGLFLLTGVHGGNLGVYVRKEGYYVTDRSHHPAFEFADPGEDNYYEPNPSNPVLFYLRKKGPGAKLLGRSVKVVLEGDGSAAKVDLRKGRISPDGQLEVQAWKPWPRRPMSPPYDWKVVVRLLDGGFVETKEEFPFEAPEAGYSPTLEIEMPATAGNRWRVSVQKTFYFYYGEPKKYGRLKIHTDGAQKTNFLEYLINTDGLRNLEPAERD